MISPKVYIPAAIQFAVGVILIVAGALLPDETLRTIGYAALGTALTTFGLGYQTKDPMRR